MLRNRLHLDSNKSTQRIAALLPSYRSRRACPCHPKEQHPSAAGSKIGVFGKAALQASSKGGALGGLRAQVLGGVDHVLQGWQHL